MLCSLCTIQIRDFTCNNLAFIFFIYITLFECCLSTQRCIVEICLCFIWYMYIYLETILGVWVKIMIKRGSDFFWYGKVWVFLGLSFPDTGGFLGEIWGLSFVGLSFPHTHFKSGSNIPQGYTLIFFILQFFFLVKTQEITETGIRAGWDQETRSLKLVFLLVLASVQVLDLVMDLATILLDQTGMMTGILKLQRLYRVEGIMAVKEIQYRLPVCFILHRIMRFVQKCILMRFIFLSIGITNE